MLTACKENKSCWRLLHSQEHNYSGLKEGCDYYLGVLDENIQSKEA
jgi:hypothetical protein